MSSCFPPTDGPRGTLAAVVGDPAIMVWIWTAFGCASTVHEVQSCLSIWLLALMRRGENNRVVIFFLFLTSVGLKRNEGILFAFFQGSTSPLLLVQLRLVQTLHSSTTASEWESKHCLNCHFLPEFGRKPVIHVDWPRVHCIHMRPPMKKSRGLPSRQSLNLIPPFFSSVRQEMKWSAVSQSIAGQLASWEE